MLDEPLGSLDRALREELVEELRTILKELGVTALYVTHDQEEAMALGDRMVIMNRGRIEQIDTPAAIYTQPATPFVATFLGFTNLLPATPSPDGVMTPLGHFPLSTTTGAKELTLLIRPEAARLVSPRERRNPGFSAWEQNSDLGFFQGRLIAATYHGNYLRVEVEAGLGGTTHSEAPNLVFNLPTYLHSHEAGEVESQQWLTLPAIGQPIQLLIDTKQATLLSYPTFTS
jgi:ABC-type Fe3+/spermidine/putrescine transport system ATPase subunit